jgi:hypothetical protein
VLIAVFRRNKNPFSRHLREKTLREFLAVLIAGLRRNKNPFSLNLRESVPFISAICGKKPCTNFSQCLSQGYAEIKPARIHNVNFFAFRFHF